MNQPEKIGYCELLRRYLVTQEGTDESLKAQLDKVEDLFDPDGLMLVQAQIMGSSWYGQHVILPYGPQCTYKQVPDHPITPRGLASDTSVVVAVYEIKKQDEP